MTVDYSKIKQVVVSVAAAVPDVASFLKHINMFSSTWCVATDLVKVSLYLPYQKGRSELYSLGTDKNIQSYPRAVNSPTLS